MPSDHGHGGYQRLDHDVSTLSTDIEAASRAVSAFSGMASQAARVVNGAQAAFKLASGAVQAMTEAARAASALTGGPAAAPAAAPAPKAAGPNMGAQIASFGPMLAGSISAAMGPLQQIGTTMTAMLDQVGGTVTTLARRLDSAMKFPQTLAAIDGVRAKIQAAFTAASGVAADQMTRVQKAVVALGPAATTALGALRGFLVAKSWFSSLGDVAGKSLSRLGAVRFAAASVSARGLASSVTLIKSSSDRASRAVSNFGKQALAALGVFGVAFKTVQFFKDGIKEASSLNETLSKTDAVMGEASAATKTFASDMANRFGLVKRETLDAATGFAGLGKGLGGLKGDALSGFANQFTMLAADLSSFANMDMTQASQALMVGLSGEQSDTLKKLGVVLTEDTVKQYALSHGIATAGKALTEQQKLAARSGLIMAKLGDASGDLERTATSPANMMRKLSGGITNIGASIGSALMPAVSEALQLLTGFASRLTAGIEANQGFFSGLAEMAGNVVDTVATGLSGAWEVLGQFPGLFEQAFGEGSVSTVASWGQAVADAVSFAGQVLRNLPAYFEVVKLKARETFINLSAWINNIPVNLGQVANYVADEWANLITDAVNRIVSVFRNLAENGGRLYQAFLGFMRGEGFNVIFKDLREGFQTTAGEIPTLIRPALVDMSKEIDAQLATIGQREVARTAERAARAAQPAAGAAKSATPEELGKPAEVKEIKSADAVEMGSKEAYSAVIKHQLRGSMPEDAIRDVAKSGREQVALLRRIADKAGNGRREPATDLFPLGA